MRSKILKISVVMILIMVMTMTNFVFVGQSLISYAMDGISLQTSTNNKNIEFAAYLKDYSGNITDRAEKNIYGEDAKLYIQLEVKNEGYFNGSITLDNSNFNLISSESEYVSNIENNVITLNQINAGTNVTIEVLVKINKEDNFDLSMLDVVSKLTLQGIYKDSSEKDRKIESTRNVSLLIQDNDSEESVVNNLEVITNKVLKVNGEDRRVIQLSLKTGLLKNDFPMKDIVAEIDVPDIDGKQPDIDKIVYMNSMNEYKYNYKDKKITISMENNKTDNRVIWKDSGSEEIILTYLYDAEVNVDNININSNVKIKLYNNKELNSNIASVNVKSDEEKQAVVTGTVSNFEAEMYKGKIYNNIDRRFTTRSEVDVNLANVAEYLTIKETDLFYSEADEQSENLVKGQRANTVITDTIINKQELLNVIGEDGNVTITNSNGIVLANINKDSQADENGNVIITYEEGQEDIIISTSAVVGTGKLHITNNKVIKQNVKELVKQATELRTVLQISNNVNTEETAIMGISKTLLKETVTDARLEINRESLSTITENKNVEITAVLKSNSEKYDLYRNARIEIEFPEDITDINVNSINKLYGDEFEFSAVKEDRNGRKVISIRLDGEQTEYINSGIEGTTIIINADLKLNNRATSKIDNFKMTYANENANGYKEDNSIGEEVKEISIVSPKGLITTSTINELGIETLGDKTLVNKVLERENKVKTITVKSEIINNDERMEDVTILGKIGADGKVKINDEEKENNLGIKLKSELNVEGIDLSKVKVYYSANEDVTADLEDMNNDWKESIDNISEIKNYMIKISDMENGEGIVSSYTVEIPGDLQYNMQGYMGYEATYFNSITQIYGKANSTMIELETGRGPVAEAKLSATVGNKVLNNDDEVKQGEVIKYTVEVKNVGNEELVDGTITTNIPEETEFVKKDETNTYVSTDSAETIKMETIPAGETITKSYELRVKKDADLGNLFKTSANVEYSEDNVMTNSLSARVAEGDIKVTVLPQTDTNSIAGEDFGIQAVIENLTNNEIKDLKVEWNISDNYDFIHQEYIMMDAQTTSDEIEENSIASSDNKSMIIRSLPANKVIYIYGNIIAKNINSKTVNDRISVKVISDNETYTSNVMDTTIIGMNNYQISLTANNENGYVKPGDEIDYVLTLKNENAIKVHGISIEDQIPSYLSVKEVIADGIETTMEDNKFSAIIDLDSDETKIIEIKTLVDYEETITEDAKIENIAILTLGNGRQIESNKVTHLMRQEEVSPDGQSLYRINGTAWLDQSLDGERQDGEENLSGITVELLDTNTNQIAKNYNNEAITATTDNSGYYTLTKIPEGNYIVVFDYDASKYTVTEYKKSGVDESKNSDVIAKSLNIDGQDRVYAVTDEISITDSNVSNINIGLIKSQGFDLSLDKYVSKIIVQNSSGTMAYEYNNQTLAKVELDSKKINNSNVIIEYSINVNNIGELEGYARNIVDYVPSELKFSSELNKDWYQSENNLYCKALANEVIKPGETKTVKLVLTKTMTETNTGRINNNAEIAECYNNAGLSDINSTPGNKARGENDMNSADVIISVKTGEVAMYAALVISMLVILGTGIYFIEKKLIRNHI